MASYVINDSGTSGYSRADFVSALEGKQDVLVSGQNIKTINNSSVLGSGNIEVNVTPPTPQEYPQEALLTDTEKQYRANTLARIDDLNPIINGKRKYMMFGFISDLHTMPTNTTINAIDDADIQSDVSAMLNAGIVFPNWQGEGNVSDAATIASHIKSAWPSSDASYWGSSSEQDIRLLGAIAFAAGIDVILCGGDLSSGRLPYNCYSYMLYYMKKMFDKYITVPHYFTDGNHERKYDSNVIRRTNTEWLKWLRILNSNGAVYMSANDGHYYPYGSGLICYDVGNTYYVDFPAHKVRVVGASAYENAEIDVNTGYVFQPYSYNLFDALSFENPSDAQEWTALGFSHYDTNPNSLQWALLHFYTGSRLGKESGLYNGSSTGYTAGFMNPNKSTTNPNYQSQYDGQSKNAQYGSGYAGKAAIGMFYGHVHTNAEFTVTIPSAEDDNRTLLNHLSIQNSSAGGYTFSIFIIDDDNYKLHWLKYGPSYNEGAVPSGFDRTANEFTLDYRHH